MPDSLHPASLPARRSDLLLAAALFLLTVVVFWPAARWLASETFAREQLKQSFFVVLLAGLWIGWEKHHRLHVNLQLSSRTLGWLFASYALAASALVFGVPILFLCGMVTAFGGMVNYVFGGQAFRRTLPVLLVFGLLILCVLLFPVLDWPLRQMAGVEAARFLKFLGLASHLAVAPRPQVKLLLLTGNQTFLVATECNGFGLITSSFLLGMIRLLYRQIALRWFLVLLPLCVAVAFVFNFLRISVIVLLAPHFPNHYAALHETAGLVALYSGLGLVWLLTGWQRLAHPIHAAPVSSLSTKV